MNDKGYFYATGRRKNAVARVRLFPGAGAIVINGEPYEKLIPQERLRKAIMEPMVVTDSQERFSISVKVSGGGYVGQAGAIQHGIARALVVADGNLRPLLRSYGLLTRDPRVKERKKYGLVRARKAKQYTKR
ncbi:MAG: 30S ribosomal protein S9 [Dehalococcoidia bacterium DG_18]|nr:MAG: 30S ribosomal protein S9 [Dehalococcoidia bacterium DG_18]